MCTSDQASCLVCRDFSGPDAVAAQHPAHSLPRGDPVGHLAHVLCGPFPSATDKARAIFTWCHHNIRYDVDSFFGQCVRPKAVNDTIFTGLAVCQGYAEVFCAVAQRAGLECVVISGHGKGFGHQPLPPGAPIPPQESNHAWNAVRIDGGRWKLVDACWGAGDVGDNRCYTKRFKPEMFFLDNALFGLKHYPTDSRRHFFLPPEVPIPSWAEYMRGPLPGGEEPAHFFTAAHEEGISEFSILPRARRIRVNSDETIRFRLTTVCDHYRGDVHGPGKPYVLLLQTHGLDGRKDQNLAFHVERDHGPGGAGRSWVLDVPARQLGAPGQTIVAMTLTKVNDRDARGWTRDMYLDRVGKPGSMAFGGLAAWDLV